MIRYIALLLLVAFGTVTGVAALQPRSEPDAASSVSGKNVTVIYKTDAFPVFGPLTFETCAVEDCSDGVEI